MKVKAVIMRPDRTNDVVVVPPRKMEGKTFKHRDCAYVVDEESFRITWDRAPIYLGWRRRYYATYYYRQGVAKPLPVTDLHSLQVIEGISGEELAAMFTPWFYRIVGRIEQNKWERVQFFLIVGLALGLGYALWALHGLNGDLEEIKQLLGPLQPGPVPIHDTGGA